jgi:hypothetical protein
LVPLRRGLPAAAEGRGLDSWRSPYASGGRVYDLQSVNANPFKLVLSLPLRAGLVLAVPVLLCRKVGALALDPSIAVQVALEKQKQIS